MKKHSLIAIAIAAIIALPLAAASRNAKKKPKPQTLMAALPAMALAAEKPATPGKAESEAAPEPVKKPASVSKPANSEPSEEESPAGKIPVKQIRARTLVTDLTTTQKAKLLSFLNEASIRELGDIHGISTTRGAAIEGARPFEGIDEVILVKGIGEGTFAEIVKHGKTLTLARTASAGDPNGPSQRKSS